MNATLDSLLSAAAKASELISKVYATDFTVEYKGPRDPVTLADKLANEAICQHLAVEFPGVPVVAEESDPREFERFRDSERIFFVDPLDGTREFVAKNGEFVVMIGLVEGDRATHGVILSPSQQTAWLGRLGEGAYRVEKSGAREAIALGTATTLTNARIAISRSSPSRALERALRVQGVGPLVALGSAGLKAMSVASGETDAYAALGAAGKRWDVCAPEALVRAAGGQFTDSTGALFDYRHQDLTNLLGIAAANPALHAELIQALRTPSDEDHSHAKP